MSKPPRKPQSTRQKPDKQSRSGSKAPTGKSKAKEDLILENEELRLRLQEAEETLNAIRAGEVDALVVSGSQGEQVYALKGAEQPYRVLVESIGEGTLSVMENGVIMNCNKAFAELAGSTCGMLVGRQFREFVAKKDLEKFSAFWKMADEREAKTELELHFDSGKVPVLISVSSRLIDGECWFFVVVTDITERKRSEAELVKYREHLERLVDEKTEELQTANKELQGANEELQMKNETLVKLSEVIALRNRELETLTRELEAFNYSISHDLRSPIRVVGGFAKALAEDYADRLDEQGRDYLTRINNGAYKMTLLIDGLLKLSQIARQKANRSDVNMSRLADSVVSALRDNEPGRIVEVSVQEKLITSADPALMELVLMNLLGNAWKFTSKTDKARIEFGALDEGGQKVFFVRDNGAGFDPAHKTKLFMPFHRLHSENQFEGTGIGLAIVERIIKAHGGKIWAEGVPGKGVVIHFTLG